MKINRLLAICGLSITALAASFASQTQAQAQAGTQALSIVAGTSCSGATSAGFTPGGPDVTISVCATASTAVCGATIQFASATSAENDLFRISTRTRSAAFDLDNNATYVFGANTITLPVNSQDLGATIGNPVAATTGVVVASFTVSPQAGATAGSYTISAGGLSSLTTSSTTCGAAVEFSSNPTFVLNKILPATSATFTSSPSTLTFAEGGAAQSVTVTCAGTIGTPSPVVISVASSNTAAFTAAPASLSFTTCPSTQTVTVTPRAADAVSNPTQTGNVTFATTTTGATAPASVAVTVNDNQTPAVYTITKASATVTEGSATTDTIVITCTGTLSTVPGSVSYSVAGISSGTDYTATPASPISFPACGGATQTITFSPRANDAIVQGNRTGTLTISAPVGGTIGGSPSASITVNDDDTPQTITVAVTGSPATEAGGVLTYTFTRAGGNPAAVATTLVVNVTPPAASTRYSTTCASTITFAANATTATCTVTGIDNTVIDGNINAVATITAPTVAGSYTVGTPASATGVIADDDTPQTITVAVTGSPATEAGGVLTYTFTRAGGNAAAVATSLVVNVTPPAASTRYSTTCAATITFAANATTATCTVTGIDNTVIDGNINAVATITAPTVAGSYTVGTPASATGVIADDDTPQTITVAVTGSPATEAGGVLTYTFTRAGGNAAAVATSLVVNVTPPAASTRYSTTCAATITFAANATTSTCTATGIGNAVVDGNVNVVVAVAAPTVAGSYTVGTPASATGIIADDDFGVTVTAVTSAITEGQSANFAINCNGASGTFTVNYTIAGRDTGSTVTPSATTAQLVCSSPTSTVTVTVSTNDDTIIGNSRNVTLTLTSVVAAAQGAGTVVVGTPASATVAVTDNDQPLIVPTMGLVGLGLMSLMLAGLAGFQQRRRALK